MVSLSVCMVSLNCWSVLENCLNSIRGSKGISDLEVILVDNASSDGTLEHVCTGFPEICVIRNKHNVGFSKATNQAIGMSSGRYILWLNTDTILLPDTLQSLCGFMERTPRAGIVGPKVLNPDGTFQPQCRRGMPTPLAILSYYVRLDKVWPQSRRIGQYLMTFLPVGQSSQVEAVSGCCLLARREVWDEIGPLDEDIFGFGEDIDWCVRAKKAGWEVWYCPESTIVHLKGQGGAHARPYRKVWGMHQAMWVFYRKHLRQRYWWIVTVLLWLAGWGSLVFSVLGVSFLRATRLTRSHSA